MKKLSNDCSKPDVYVLMRLFCADLSDADSYFTRIQDSLISVKDNKDDYKLSGGKVVLIINDDTDSGTDINLYNSYLDERNRILDDLFEDGWIDTKNVHHMGSSAAMINLRLFFKNLEHQHLDDIAVTLDQDDVLAKGAIVKIAANMEKDGIVISAYDVEDNYNLDISDGKERHNQLVNRIAKGEITEVTSDLLSGFSSFGWTKAYSRCRLTQYVDDLCSLLLLRGGADKYFRDHQAYEDFIDFYPLLFEGVALTCVPDVTHIYRKNPDSITAKPSVEDFRDHRTANLIALIDLCYAHEYPKLSYYDEKKKEIVLGPFTPLKYDYKIGLIRFVSSKVAEIENIISSRYIDGYIKEGNSKFADFAAQTHYGYFISKLARLALGDRRNNEQDKELFRYKTSRSKESKSNFEDLFSARTVELTPNYEAVSRYSTARYVLRKTVSYENELKGRKAKEDDAVDKLIGKSNTPRKRQYEKIKRYFTIFLWVFSFVLVILILSLLLSLIKRYFPESDIFRCKIIETFRSFIVDLCRRFGNAIAACLGLGGAILTYLGSEQSKIKLLAENDYSLVKMYYSEFIDFIRHLEANLKIMAQIRKDISDGGTYNIQEIHFDNLKWPLSSCLFSDEIAKVLDKNRVDDFTRLKVNIRNINNSADWLLQKSREGQITAELLDWEITRYMGYLLNMYYLEMNDFSFPTPNELDLFIHESAQKFKLTRIFMDDKAEERERKVNYYIERYLDDRRMKRAVLVKKAL